MQREDRRTFLRDQFFGSVAGLPGLRMPSAHEYHSANCWVENGWPPVFEKRQLPLDRLKAPNSTMLSAACRASTLVLYSHAKGWSLSRLITATTGLGLCV